MSARSKPSRVDLLTVLELVSDADGPARGEMDGVPLALTGNRELRVPFASSFPGEIVSLDRPPGGNKWLGGANLHNRSLHPEWMALAFAAANLREQVERLLQSGLEVDVQDAGLTATFRGSPTGPEVRQAVRALAQIAKSLPVAMAEVVHERSRHAAAERIKVAEKNQRIERERVQNGVADSSDAERERLQLARRLSEVRLLTGFGSLLMLAAFAVVAPVRHEAVQPGPLFLCFAALGVVVGWSAYFVTCPRCGKGLVGWVNPLLVTGCRTCGLRPR